ncbi:hypothetical protein [Burkholderia ubonensis]|uniref:hypothetical protein n=1 Tax=Burkholderia ubonensis TaxID=101571 RepID=UPI0008FE9C5E|nr:hypothetical protein [Burkholderia ubonensis]OJA84433.1 hypothetical protein BGV49_21940 [Burkholderia ubonensis]
MDDVDRIKTFQAMADVSRKWITTLDAKAGFLVAVNGALLGFIWASAKLPDCPLHWVKALAYVSSALAFFSLFIAMLTVFPRIKLDTKPTVKHISFYAYVASKYPQQDGARFTDDVLAMTDADLAREALEQHLAICHVAMFKNSGVMYASGFWIAALIFAAVAAFCRGLG